MDIVNHELQEPAKIVNLEPLCAFYGMQLVEGAGAPSIKTTDKEKSDG